MSKEVGRIYQSNGERFDLLTVNRSVIRRKVDEIKEVIVKMATGFWLGLPALICKTLEADGIWTYWVLDAQHRATAFIELGLPITYIIEESLERPAVMDDFLRWRSLIISINNKQSAWKLRDYLQSHITAGNKHYQRFHDWMQSMGVSNIDTCIYMCGHDNSSRSLDKFRDGLFVFTNEAEEIGTKRIKELQEISVFGDTWCWENKFARVWLAVRDRKGYSHKRMLSQLQKVRKTEMFQPKGTRDQYTRMIDEIYNKNNPSKIPLLY